ncbi:hypothetical protein BH09GEM1_BH09GEM1_06510 [soil metagenome]
MIFARRTVKYGKVYFRARRSSVSCSSRDSVIENGLFLGMDDPSSAWTRNGSNPMGPEQ